MSEQSMPRADSKLKRLPLPIMREIVRRCGEPNMRQVDILAWLKAEHGVKSSDTALSEALSYLAARVRAADRDQKVDAWLECEKLEHPELSDEELFRRGQRKFSLLSIAEEDPKGWVAVQKLSVEKSDQQLSREKFELLKAQAEKAGQTEAVMKQPLTDAEKAAKIKEIYGL